MGAVIEWDWLDRKYCDGEIRGEDGSWRSLFALLRAGVLLLNANEVVTWRALATL